MVEEWKLWHASKSRNRDQNEKRDAMKMFRAIFGRKIDGVLSGWDRMRFRGTIRWLANNAGLNSYLSLRSILLKDFGKWAESITSRVRSICSGRAETMKIPVIYLRSASINKEEYARLIMKERSITTGDICMFSIVEPCTAPVVRGNRDTKKINLKMETRKCIWIYHYWNDRKLGFGHTRLQTWLPLNVMICVNGRHWLERQLIHEGVGYVKSGNCFTHIDDYQKAAELVEKQQRTNWPELLDGLTRRLCPGINSLFGGADMNHYWSANETEWATDIVFQSAKELDRLFPKLARYGLMTAQSPAVMRFLGRINRGRQPNEVRSDLRRRYEGLRVKHWVNNNSVKMYNKAGNVLRTETTINQPREFKVFRHPNDDLERPPSWQKMRKGVCDLHRRASVSQAANQRYLDHLASANVAENLQERIGKICKRVRKNGNSHRAINPWNPLDFQTLQFLALGQHQLNGIVNQQLRTALHGACSDPIQRKKLSAATSRRLRLLRGHGLIRKIPRANRYHLTRKGRKIVTALMAASSADTKQLMDLAA